MKMHLHQSGSGTGHGRQVTGAFGLVVVLAVSSLPIASPAALAPATATGWGIDDMNTSTLIPNTVNNGKNTPDFFTGQCPWITAAMNSFVAANPNNTWTWAVPTFNLMADLTVVDYSAWVVTSPNTANGFALSGGVAGKDAGGADFGLTYKPTAPGSPANILFIQAYQEILYGRNGNPNPQTNIRLDNGGGAGPQYGGASSYGAAESKMGDEPYDSETDANPSPEGYHTDVQFQTVIAVNNPANGKNNYTLYQGAEWWGYQYTNTDVPEPATVIAGALPVVLLVARGIRQWRLLSVQSA
jgi:hypothetical protein